MTLVYLTNEEIAFIKSLREKKENETLMTDAFESIERTLKARRYEFLNSGFMSSVAVIDCYFSIKEILKGLVK